MPVINFDKNKNGLVPVIIQHIDTLQVLMLGYMNQAAYEKTIAEKKVTFFSRSKSRLWTKGETSGNFLQVKTIQIDCDQDTILIQVIPTGPTCHKGTTSCFAEVTPRGFIYQLERKIQTLIDLNDPISQTNALYKRGINKVAQKVGEEAVELVIEAIDNNDFLFKNEAADLIYHFLILLKSKGFAMKDIEAVLLARAKERTC
jgi:phosphoribosyl-ATP pyrophosphohydrolase/phosphoribosyl-AMP cyclohydrolase